MTPHATPEAPAPMSVLSTTRTSPPSPRPRSRSSVARCHAVDSPWIPAPTITYLAFGGMVMSLTCSVRGLSGKGGDGRAEDALVGDDAETAAGRHRDAALLDPDRVRRVVVAVHERLGDPDAVEQARVDRRRDVGAGGRDDVPTPGVVAGVG